MKEALSKKGFQRCNTHHEMFWLHAFGKKTSVKTFFSHGLKEYGAGLLGQMRKQLRLDSAREFDSLMDCPMGEEEYRQLLVERGHVIEPKESEPEA